jgi:hypothetical protein
MACGASFSALPALQAEMNNQAEGERNRHRWTSGTFNNSAGRRDTLNITSISSFQRMILQRMILQRMIELSQTYLCLGSQGIIRSEGVPRCCTIPWHLALMRYDLLASTSRVIDLVAARYDRPSCWLAIIDNFPSNTPPIRTPLLYAKVTLC